jgi:hypothetical protein
MSSSAASRGRRPDGGDARFRHLPQRHLHHKDDAAGQEAEPGAAADLPGEAPLDHQAAEAAMTGRRNRRPTTLAPLQDKHAFGHPPGKADPARRAREGTVFRRIGRKLMQREADRARRLRPQPDVRAGDVDPQQRRRAAGRRLQLLLRKRAQLRPFPAAAGRRAWALAMARSLPCNSPTKVMTDAAARRAWQTSAWTFASVFRTRWSRPACGRSCRSFARWRSAATSIPRQGRQRPRTVSRQAAKLRRGPRRAPAAATSTGLAGSPAQVTVCTTSWRNQMMQSRGSRVTERTSAPAATSAKAAAAG